MTDEKRGRKMFSPVLILSLMASLILTPMLSGCGAAGDPAAGATAAAGSETAATETAAATVAESTAEGDRSAAADASGSGADSTEEAAAETSEADSEDAPADKSESVHVQADALGNPEEITVTATLRNPGGSASLTDLSSLSDIKNKEGDEEFTLDADGHLTWENHGEDIIYEGKSSGDLPVSVHVSYYLDDEEISPADLAGKSGHVRIRFDYENHTVETVQVKGANHQVPIPFVAISAAFLPADNFANVKVENGRVLSMENQNIVIGYAMPGLGKALKLSAWEPTEEIEIPDFVELEADVTDFELSFTATVLSSGLLKDLDPEDLNDVDDMIDGMDELSDAVDELEDGSGEMADALHDFKGYMKDYTKGVVAVDEGVQGLDEGIQTLSKNKGALLTGAKGLRDGLKELNKGLKKMDFGNSEDPDMQAVSAAIQALAKDGEKLQKLLEEAGMSEEDMTAFAKDAAAYAKAVKKAVKESNQDLSKIDFSGLEAMLTKKAQAQADAALQAALSDTELSDEEKDDIRAAVADAIDLSGLTSDASAYLKSALNSLGDLPELTIPDLKVDQKKLNTILEDMSDQADVLLEHTDTLGDMAEGLSGLGASLDELKKGVSELYKGSKQLATGISTFNEGIDTLAEGSGKLAGGSSELADAGDDLVKGSGEMAEAMDKMHDGIKEFRDEGVSELTDLAGDDLQRIADTLRALQQTDAGYNNFSGLEDGKKGEVRFIIETAEIKPE